METHGNSFKMPFFYHVPFVSETHIIGTLNLLSWRLWKVNPNDVLSPLLQRTNVSCLTINTGACGIASRHSTYSNWVMPLQKRLTEISILPRVPGNSCSKTHVVHSKWVSAQDTCNYLMHSCGTVLILYNSKQLNNRNTSLKYTLCTKQ